MRLFAAIGALSLFGALIAFTPARADTEKRVALVIGNGDYKSAPRLENPPIDARAVAASLKRLGFDVIEGYDESIGQMRASVARFSAELRDAKAAIVYYAGHGVSVDDENYLIPTDIVLKSPTDLDLNAISVSLILRQMKREDRVNVVILDACRENPFATDLAYAGSRSVIGARGLSAIDGDLARGTLIAFASDPKSIALDGFPGEHSPFTKALIDHLEDPAVSIDTVMNRVRTEVWESTKKKQLPWVNTSIIGEFDLNPQPAAALAAGAAPAAAAAAPEPETVAQENLMWESAQRSNLVGDYHAYLDAYPKGVYAPMAKNRIASLTDVTGAKATARETPAVKPEQSGREDLLWQSAQQSNLAADYQAYLQAYPSGVYAPLAKNRIASLSSAPAAAPGMAPPGPDAPPAVSPAALSAEVGTMETERALNLGPPQIMEVQQRLALLGFDVDPATGAFTDQARRAIGEWQKRHSVASTSWLGPLELSALRAESEAAYRTAFAPPPPAALIGVPAVAYPVAAYAGVGYGRAIYGAHRFGGSFRRAGFGGGRRRR
jgi:hypothetical protein